LHARGTAQGRSPVFVSHCPRLGASRAHPPAACDGQGDGRPGRGSPCCAAMSGVDPADAPPSSAARQRSVPQPVPTPACHSRRRARTQSREGARRRMRSVVVDVEASMPSSSGLWRNVHGSYPGPHEKSPCRGGVGGQEGGSAGITAGRRRRQPTQGKEGVLPGQGQPLSALPSRTRSPARDQPLPAGTPEFRWLPLG